jgi:hypothetical protein
MSAGAPSRRIGDVVKCENCQADRQIVNIEKTSDGKKITLVCRHTFVDRVMVVTENLDITENVDSITEKNPVEGIRKAVMENDYAKIVILACSVFENYGKEILAWYLNEDEKNQKNENNQTGANNNTLT